MAYDRALKALGDVTRQLIFDRVRVGRASVGEIAAEFPISQSAVSQHLKVLREAGLVRDQADGTRRIYEVDPVGLGELRAWLNHVGGDVSRARNQRRASQGRRTR